MWVFLWVWVLQLSGSYLECNALQVATLHHLSWSLSPSKWRDTISILHKLSLLSSSFPFIPFASSLRLYSFSLCYFFSFTTRSSLYSLLHFVHLIPQSSSSSPYNCVFPLCPLEVNLHTYLTTWLSSCLVGTFFGFSP